MEMSNKSLALLLVAAIVISLGGTLISLNKLSQEGLTGMLSTAGQVQLAVSTNMSCTIDSNVSFGSSGRLETTTTISTNSTNSGTNFTNCVSNSECTGMLVNNSGNVNIFVNFSSNVSGSTLLGRADSDFTFIVYNGTNGSLEPGCRGGLPTAWANVPTTATSICTNLTSNSTNNMMIIEYNITLTQDTIPGTKTAGITVNCGQN